MRNSYRNLDDNIETYTNQSGFMGIIEDTEGRISTISAPPMASQRRWHACGQERRNTEFA